MEESKVPASLDYQRDGEIKIHELGKPEEMRVSEEMAGFLTNSAGQPINYSGKNPLLHSG